MGDKAYLTLLLTDSYLPGEYDPFGNSMSPPIDLFQASSLSQKLFALPEQSIR
jgi:hypothetical protein